LYTQRAKEHVGFKSQSFTATTGVADGSQ
jgi:hypothetical protein